MKEKQDALEKAQTILQNQKLNETTIQNILTAFEKPIFSAYQSNNHWLDGFIIQTKVNEIIKSLNNQITEILKQIHHNDIFSAQALSETQPPENKIRICQPINTNTIQKIIKALLIEIFPPYKQSPEAMNGVIIGDKYQIIGICNKNKHTIIYKARTIVETKDGNSFDTVAIKTINNLNNKKTQNTQNLQKEFQIQKGLYHPNIHNHIELITNSETSYLITEYIDGETLAEYLQKNKLNNNQILAIAYELASAIDYLHENKIIHLDMNEKNVLITHNESVKVIDFGISKQGIPLATKNGKLIAEVTKNGDFMAGTLPYMSPECFEIKQESTNEISMHFISQKTRITKNADIWSFGIQLYHIIFNDYPFGKEINELIYNFDNIKKALKNIKKELKNKSEKEIFTKIFIPIFTKDIKKRPTSCLEIVENLNKILNKFSKKKINFNLQSDFLNSKHIPPEETTEQISNIITKKKEIPQIKKLENQIETIELLKLNEATKRMQNLKEIQQDQYNGIFQTISNNLYESIVEMHLIPTLNINHKFIGGLEFNDDNCIQCLSFPSNVTEIHLITPQITSKGYSILAHLPHLKTLHISGENINPIHIMALQQKNSQQQLEKLVLKTKMVESFKIFVEEKFKNTKIIWQ